MYAVYSFNSHQRGRYILITATPTLTRSFVKFCVFHFKTYKSYTFRICEIMESQSLISRARDNFQISVKMKEIFFSFLVFYIKYSLRSGSMTEFCYSYIFYLAIKYNRRYIFFFRAEVYIFSLVSFLYYSSVIFLPSFFLPSILAF